jgi:hypothetical protein
MNRREVNWVGKRHGGIMGQLADRRDKQQAQAKKVAKEAEADGKEKAKSEREAAADTNKKAKEAKAEAAQVVKCKRDSESHDRKYDKVLRDNEVKTLKRKAEEKSKEIVRAYLAKQVSK